MLLATKPFTAPEFSQTFAIFLRIDEIVGKLAHSLPDVSSGPLLRHRLTSRSLGFSVAALRESAIYD
ncbi:MAG: hypothetical protein COB09_17855 [Thalassobium sp.]|nr:MAG: hypothetical protein COB09_17855 [Thalassobium sp.]